MTTIDEARRTVVSDGKTLELPNGEFEVFLALARADGKILDRAQIMSLADIGSPRAVDTIVCRIRRKLGRSAIKTVCCVGYKAVGVVVN